MSLSRPKSGSEDTSIESTSYKPKLGKSPGPIDMPVQRGHMQHYRLYCLDGTGSLGLAESIEATDDADAIRQAQEIKRGALKCEVWLGQRLVATLDGDALSR